VQLPAVLPCPKDPSICCTVSQIRYGRIRYTQSVTTTRACQVPPLSRSLDVRGHCLANECLASPRGAKQQDALGGSTRTLHWHIRHSATCVCCLPVWVLCPLTPTRRLGGWGGNKTFGWMGWSQCKACESMAPKMPQPAQHQCPSEQQADPARHKGHRMA
jgi:hypothetical protein